MQSVHAPHQAVLVEVETCTPLVGCTVETTMDQEATKALRDAQPLGRFVGLDIFFDRGHLAVNEVKKIINNSNTLNEIFTQLSNLPFYRAMAFTLTFTFVVTPFVIIFGFFIAIGVNAISSYFKGSAVQWIASDPNLSLKASTGVMWLSLIIYGIWHAAPFAFVIFYAGLQTLPQDQIEAAKIDGASRYQQIRYIVIPHLFPLITFVALIQLMDNFRVFEPIVGFNASAHAQSLSWFIFNDLGGETRQLSSAAASSVLTIIGVSILLFPVLLRTWRDFREQT